MGKNSVGLRQRGRPQESTDTTDRRGDLETVSWPRGAPQGTGRPAVESRVLWPVLCRQQIDGDRMEGPVLVGNTDARQVEPRPHGENRSIFLLLRVTPAAAFLRIPWSPSSRLCPDLLPTS